MDEDQFLSVLKRLQIEHLEPKIREIVKAEFEEERKNFWVPAEKHYLAHVQFDKCSASMAEKEANHAFVSSMRKRGQAAFNIGFGLAVVGVCGLVATIISDGFRHWVWAFFMPKGGA
jgi:hypothetical protein